VRTVGVDIAKSHETTAVCTIRWTDDGADVDNPQIPASDRVVLEAARAPDVAAIAFDAPFGWPVAMVAAVSAWRPGGRWSNPEDTAFRLRRTDAVTARRSSEMVKERREANVAGQQPAVPLSVSADKIAMAAWRCCALLDALALGGVEVVTDAVGRPFPSDGVGRIVEAYPAAALSVWGIPREGYKSADSEGVTRRRALLDALAIAGGRAWLRMTDNVRERYVATDHALDALVCALVARAAMLGLVDAVPPDDIAAARAEGWIAVPHPDSLRALSLRSASPK
jgi:Protein of unknown function (DUF429)